MIAPVSGQTHEPAAEASVEIARGERFRFGANWAAFLRTIDDARIARAEASLRDMLGAPSLAGRSFLDIGCGSGLFSLAAHRLGAAVTSFDYDEQSVACARELRARYAPDAHDWSIRRGSVLDEAHMREIGTHDVVYAWGVLHHTGDMARALDLAGRAVRDGGTLFIAIYNAQPFWSDLYTRIKRRYVRSPRLVQRAIAGGYIASQVAKGAVKDVVLFRNPVERYRARKRERGMSMFHDWIDWIGGYPFEVAKPEAIFEFYRARGFALQRLNTCGGGQGCNEFVFRRLVSA